MKTDRSIDIKGLWGGLLWVVAWPVAGAIYLLSYPAEWISLFYFHLVGGGSYYGKKVVSRIRDFVGKT